MHLSRLREKVLRMSRKRPGPKRRRPPSTNHAHPEEAFKAARPDASLRRPLARSLWLQLAAAGLLLVSCKTAVPPPSGEVPPPLPPEDRAPPPLQVPDEKAAHKRRQAAAALTDRGRALLTDGQIDPAMRLFEQALSLAPQYGPGYYYLADAWLLKNNRFQAREFHRQAVLYLQADTAWQKRVEAQRRRIERAAGPRTP